MGVVWRFSKPIDERYWKRTKKFAVLRWAPLLHSRSGLSWVVLFGSDLHKLGGLYRLVPALGVPCTHGHTVTIKRQHPQPRRKPALPGSTPPEDGVYENCLSASRCSRFDAPRVPRCTHNKAHSHMLHKKTCKRTHEHAHTRTQAQMGAHAHMRTQPNTRTHAHMHTVLQSCIPMPCT